MKKLKLITIIGTRPEVIKLSEFIKKADVYFDHKLIHTGQNWDYKLNKVFFDDFGLREPDFYLESVGKNLGETIGNIISKSYDLLYFEKPDAVLILGDTNSSLAAISAKRLKIPIFHMEAGNRCFDQNLPEEINRKIVDHISDINMPYTENARRYLVAEGYRAEHIFVTGSPLKEVIMKNVEKIENSEILENMNLEKNRYILLSAHREENIDNEENFMGLMDAMNKISIKYNMKIIFSVHPRSLAMIKKHDFKFEPLIKMCEPFGFYDYNKLQKNAFCVISDSGTLAEESSMLKFPAVSIRTSTERPEAIDKGNFIIGGIKYNEIIQAIELCKNMLFNGEYEFSELDEYNELSVSTKVVKIIQGYTSIINKFVWRK